MIEGKRIGRYRKSMMTLTNTPNRCRLVLVAYPETTSIISLGNALSGGDVASVILAGGQASEKEFQSFCELAVPVIQAAGAAAMIAENSQIAGRAKADGLHVTAGVKELADAVDKLSPRLIVGTSTTGTRHDALDKGELRPDYVFFGKLDGDTHPDAHSKNIELAQWWAAIIEIPCIVMAGYLAESVLPVASTGAEFVALSAAVFGEGRDPEKQVALVNELLDSLGDFPESDHAN
jgi:thiamine-phosphate pyrophosphorylase